MLAFILACSTTPVPELPAGSWVLEGPGATGSLRTAEDSCRIALDGGTWGTLGEVSCRAHAQPRWLVFTAQTALGEVDAVTRWEDQALVVPLGSREGEFELRLARTPGQGDTRGVDALRLEGERAAWQMGRFRLEGPFAGELDLARWTLELAGPQVWTDEPELLEVVEQGMDLVLSAPVEPSLEGASTVFRVNRVLRQGVLPRGDEPSEQDLSFALVSGPWESREADRNAALEASVESEQARLESLAEELRPGLGGPCPEQVPVGLSQAMWGYALRFEQGEAGCALVVEPEPVQHGRRLAVRIEASGIVQRVQR